MSIPLSNKPHLKKKRTIFSQTQQIDSMMRKLTKGDSWDNIQVVILAWRKTEFCFFIFLINESLKNQQ